MSDGRIERNRNIGFIVLFAVSIVQTHIQVQEVEEAVGKSAQEVLVQDTRNLAKTVSEQERQKDLEVLEKQLEGTKEAADTLDERSEDKVREAAEEAGRRADAKIAAAAIEEATVEVENQIAELPAKDEQATAELNQKFKAEQDELVGKLDKMRDNYFEKHPDLDEGQRTDAEQTFKTIKDDAVGALKADQDSRLAKQQTQQQDLRDKYQQELEELEGTRDHR